LKVTPALLVLLVACAINESEEEPLRLNAAIVFPPRDTIRLSLPVTTYRCTNGSSLLMQAASPEGSGVLVLLRYRESLGSAPFPVVPPGDTRARGAVVVVRYSLREATHFFAFDSGSVQVTREGDKISGHIQGSGVQNAIHTPTTIDYHDVELPGPADTASCVVQR
jgi:hypothetical protein